jgi:hypothetical protein
MFRTLVAAGALLVALVISTPGNAETYASACKAPDGTIYNLSEYRSHPVGGCRKPGSTVVRFMLEQPNHAMAKRSNTLVAPDRVIIQTFHPGHDLPTFEVVQQLDGSECSLFVDVYDTSLTILPAGAGPLPPPPPPILGTAAGEEALSVVLAAAESGSIDGNPSQIEIIAAGGETLVIEDTKAILDAAGVEGCYVAGIFRYFRTQTLRDAR